MKKIVSLLVAFLLVGCNAQTETDDPVGITHIVTFDANGGQFESGLSTTSFDVDEGSLLSYPTIPCKPGYDIKVDSSGCPIWENNGEAWSFSTMKVNEDITLKCLWNIKEYVICYDCDGGINDSSNPSSYTVLDEIELKPATKEGYEFNGWRDEGDNIVSKIEVGSVGNLILKAKWSQEEYLLTANSNDTTMGEVSGDGTYKYGENATLTASPNPGYEFNYWSIEGDSMNYYGNPFKIRVSEEMKIVAHFSIVTYSITYDLGGGTINGTNPTSYTVLDELNLFVPNLSYYYFVCYVDQNGNSYTKIEPGTTGDLHLTASYGPYNYKVNVTQNYPTGGTVTGGGLHGHGTSVTITATPSDGFWFHYYDYDWNIYETRNPFTFEMPKYDLTFNTIFAPYFYNIEYVLDGGTNHPDNPSQYTVLTDFELKDPTKSGYQFFGWYTEDGERVTRISPGGLSKITLYAHWEIIKHNLVVTSENTNKGTVTIVQGSGYATEEVKLSATPVEGYYFDGWYHNNYRIWEETSYEFNMPYSDLTLEARFFDKTSYDARIAEYNSVNGVTPTISGNVITYGLTPQGKVSDKALIQELNTLLVRSENTYYLVDGYYYERITGKTSVSWFKCEPIRWRILEQQNNEYYVLSERIIAAHMFSDYNSTFNNSGVRYLLNIDFYNKSFFFDNSYIKTMNIDGENLLVAVPSAYDVTNPDYGFRYNGDRKCSSTDFAIASGLDSDTTGGKASYWLRDYNESQYRATAVLSDGEIDSTNTHCYFTRGVRPVMRFMIPSN